jgi:uncharacterized membrane protein YcaP (DUF421 family)
MKLMGKRQVGEMQMSELVTALFLSELATYAVTDLDVPLAVGLLSVMIMICFEVIISFLAVKSPLFKKLFDVSPAILIRNGSVLERELMKNRITLDELFSMLRLNGYYDLNKVNFAILEPNGQLSVVPFEKDESPSKEEMKLPFEEKGFTVAVIDDGKINQKGLKAIGKDEKWVEKYLKQKKTKKEKVFLLISDYSGNLRMFPKEKG